MLWRRHGELGHPGRLDERPAAGPASVPELTFPGLKEVRAQGLCKAPAQVEGRLGPGRWARWAWPSPAMRRSRRWRLPAEYPVFDFGPMSAAREGDGRSV